MTTFNRRSFVAASSVALAAPVLATRPATAALLRRMDGGMPASFPTQDPEIVREVVGKSHVDYDRVRELVTQRPELAKATWDWGFGDWESALGAASHMGRRDMAELLMEHGARANHFTFAMMDQVDVVRAVCEANPGIQRRSGPHGITLFQHARHGKASRVMEYLETLGDADLERETLPLDESIAAPYVGSYEADEAPDVVFTVKYDARRNVLKFARGEYTPRFLMRVADDTFGPGGAASVKIKFDVRNGAAKSVAIIDGPFVVRARRIG